MPTYSIVIPVYNAAKYLESCIDSILGQQGASDYEVILVNDGSTDQSPRICDRYAEQVSCIKVIHQANQGVSAARNAGLAAAAGEYVLFLDGDDYWSESLLRTMDGYIPQSPDLIEFGYRKFSEKGILEVNLPAAASCGGTGQEYFAAHSKMNRMPIAACWAAAFRRQFLIENGLRFPLGVSYGEDLNFHMNCLKQAQRVCSICEPLYMYRVNEASATHTPSLKKAHDLLLTCAGMYRLFPCAMLADYYCMNILSLANFKRDDVEQLKELLAENRDILRHVSGRKARIARILYQVLGVYNAAKLVRFLVNLRHAESE